MQSRSLVLVFAQSGRFLAETATRAGFRVRVADCFGDEDTLAVAESWQPLSDYSSLTVDAILEALIHLSDDTPCWLICGAGVERYYSLLNHLPPHIQFIGNSYESFCKVRDPAKFFGLLNDLALPFPPITFSTEPQAERILIKDMKTSGGSGVKPHQEHPLSESQYVQRYIEGQTRSACFIANGTEATILGWNSQIHRSSDFTLIEVQQPNIPNPTIQSQITDAVERLTLECGLRGFNSLDFMIDHEGEIYLLELNPRITASVELIKNAAIFDWHFTACRGDLPEMDLRCDEGIRILHYMFAKRPLTIIGSPTWPPCCHDLPQPGSQIQTDMPICTIIIDASTTASAYQILTEACAMVMKNCQEHA